MNDLSAIDLTVYDSLDSTNEEARRRVTQGQTGPQWIAARQQTVGRGRQGRTWSTAPGNLAATFLCPVDGGPGDAALFSFVAALAVADTFDRLTQDVDVALKWPNDVLLNRRKASGILLESLQGGTAKQGTILAMGIGMNLAHHPDLTDAVWAATSVLAETGSPPEFEDALDELIDAMNRRIAQKETRGFDAIRSDWLDRAVNLDSQIQVRLPGETLTGRFAGLDGTGALVLEQETGRRLIAAGDVFFPEAA